MTFDKASDVEMACYQMRYSDYTRARNRALVDGLFNGDPPQTPEQAEADGRKVNVNRLDGVRISHDARSQITSAFTKPGKFFSMTTDSGAVHKRQARSMFVTNEIMKPMKASLPYFETLRAKFGGDILHGVGPSICVDQDHWCTRPVGIEDVMFPDNTFLTDIATGEVPQFALYCSYTAPQLIKMTTGPRCDPGWNKPLVQACLKWIDEQCVTMMQNNWPEFWSPDKQAERVKSSGGCYTGSRVPTINAWNFYFLDDRKNTFGWKRRTVLDSWSMPTMTGGMVEMSRRKGSLYDEPDNRNQFLYDSGDTIWGNRLSEIINFQFADLSGVFPAHYHSIRSLGFLLYSVLNLQNRLYSRFTEAAFEQMMIYFRVKSQDDFQRALKVDMIDKGFIDDTIQFLPPGDRYQINANFQELVMRENANLIAQNSQSYTGELNTGQSNQERPTATQYMGDSSKTQQLVSAALLQANRYQKTEYVEQVRRFFKKDSKDPEVRTFRVNCLKNDIPETMLRPECWEVLPEQLLGDGNKMEEAKIAQGLLSIRQWLDPEPQRRVLKNVALAITGSPDEAKILVPDQPQVSNSVHDAQLASGTLMQGLPVAIKSGINHTEYVEALLTAMSIVIKQIQQTDGVGTPDKLMGLQNMAQHIDQHIQIIAQDPNEQQRVKQYGDALGKLMNLVKAFGQRLQEQMQAQAQQGGNGQPDPAVIAKIKSDQMVAQAKIETGKQSSATRTAQKQITFEQKMQQDKQRHEQEMQKDAQAHAVETMKEIGAHQLDMRKGIEKVKLDLTSSRIRATKKKPLSNI